MSAAWVWTDAMPSGVECYWPNGELAAWVWAHGDAGPVHVYVWADTPDAVPTEHHLGTLAEGKAAAEAALADLVRS